jgi:hypothetical protein
LAGRIKAHQAAASEVARVLADKERTRFDD